MNVDLSSRRDSTRQTVPLTIAIFITLRKFVFLQLTKKKKKIGTVITHLFRLSPMVIDNIWPSLSGRYEERPTVFSSPQRSCLVESSRGWLVSGGCEEVR